MNIIVILAGGVGNRFGDAVPKQYHLLNGRPVIEYAVRAALTARHADEVVVAAQGDYVRQLADTYGVIAVEGGDERNRSFRRVLDYIRTRFDCDKLLVTDAVNPMVTAALFDTYFDLLEEYDAVLTAAPIPTSLGCFDQPQVDRSRYYLIQSPHGYHFPMVDRYFDQDSPLTVIAQQLPPDIRTKLYWDFTDNAKIIYPHDLAAVGALLRERERRVRFESHKSDVSLGLFRRLRGLWAQEVRAWEKTVDADAEALLEKWEITEYDLNPDAGFALVFEGRSARYGPVVMKLVPPFIHRFARETEAIRALPTGYPVTPLDIDEARCAMLLPRVIPGDYAELRRDRAALAAMLTALYDAAIPTAEIEAAIPHVPDFLDELRERFQAALRFGRRTEDCRRFFAAAEACYRSLGSERYLVHGDIAWKNTLRGKDGLRLIDPLGYRAPRVLEAARFLSYTCLREGRTPEAVIGELLPGLPAGITPQALEKAMLCDMTSMLFGAILWRDDGFRRAEEWAVILTPLADKYA